MFDNNKYYYLNFSAFLHGVIIYLLLYLYPAFGQQPDTTEVTADTKTSSQDINTESIKPIKDNSNELVFIPGDALEITVYPDTASFPNGIYSIDDKGYAYLPILGYKKVSDKTVSRLETLLKEAYVNYLPQPNIQVRPLIRVSLLGGFTRPGLYWVDSRDNMWSIVQNAGGTMREDGLEKLKWRRNRVTISKDLIPHIESGESLQSIGFKSGDQIRVTYRPRQRFWDVFRSDVLPILSFTISAVASAASVYIAYQMYQERQ